MTKPPKAPSHHYLLPDLLRVIFITIIVLNHIEPRIVKLVIFRHPFFNHFFDLSLTSIAVSGFVLLSGFVNQLVFKPQPYSTYIKKKLIDIYPLYWISLTIAMILHFSNISSRVHEIPIATTSTTACSLLGVCAFFIKWGGPFMATSWFIGLILVLYACLPPISIFMEYFGKIRVTLFILLISLISRYFFLTYPSGHIPNEVSWHPLSRLLEFTLGIYIAKNINPRWLFPLKTRVASYRWQLISKIVFPIFLLHHPLLFIFARIVKGGEAIWVGLTWYLFATISLSYLVLRINEPLKVALKRKFLN